MCSTRFAKRAVACATLIVALLGGPVSKQLPAVASVDPGATSQTHVQQMRPRLWFPVARRTLPVQSVIVGFEVSQGVQRPDNSVALVSHRPTIVRATLTSPIAHTAVSAWLHAYQNNIELAGSPIPAINHPRTLKATANRVNIDDTFNFRPPSAWLNGTITFRVRATNHSTYSALSQMSTFRFSPAPPLHVTVVPVHYTCTSGGSGVNAPTPPYDYLVNAYTRKVYPAPSVTIQTRSVPVYYSGQCVNNVPAPNFDEWIGILNAVTAAWQADGSPARYYYGLLNINCGASEAAGIAWVGYYRAAAGYTGCNNIVTPHAASKVHAHELGHNHGLYHAPGCGPTGSGYPYLDSQGRALIGTAAAPNFGLDVYDTPSIYPYTTTFDYMSYCGPAWTSDYTYLRIRDYALMYNAPPAQLPTATLSPQIFVRGYVLRDASGRFSAAHLNPLFVLDAQASPYTTQSVAPLALTLEMLDAEDQIVAAHSVGLRQVSQPASTGEEVFAFQELLPNAPGIAAVRLRQGDRVLAERRSGPIAPRVQPALKVLAPTSSETWALAWEASDEDADPLSYLVRLSTDGGQSWWLIGLSDAPAGALSQNGLPALTLSRLVAPELFTAGQLWIEVQVSDGIRTHVQRFAQSDPSTFRALTPSD
ncbi:MAG: hypothetical protein RMN25_10515 [Anaerolineae bacterium]|nr:hypothetical protein [Thermoflexales bacterium]MDW8408199.1 hypothetical protein [Anaerolineae bacterium]